MKPRNRKQRVQWLAQKFGREAVIVWADATDSEVSLAFDDMYREYRDKPDYTPVRHIPTCIVCSEEVVWTVHCGCGENLAAFDESDIETPWHIFERCDYMTEIKKRFTCEHGSWKSSCGICQLVQEIEEQKAENASLITTIESLQRELQHSQSNMKMADSSISAKNTLIESQKEEIEKLKSYRVIKNYTDILVECNSYKAITELAVNGLKEISQFKHYPDDHYNHSFQKIQRKSVTTLAEIERLALSHIKGGGTDG
jgi:hypothetical protein